MSGRELNACEDSMWHSHWNYSEHVLSARHGAVPVVSRPEWDVAQLCGGSQHDHAGSLNLIVRCGDKFVYTFACIGQK